jgi:hypothetical protein
MDIMILFLRIYFILFSELPRSGHISISIDSYVDLSVLTIVPDSKVLQMP